MDARCCACRSTKHLSNWFVGDDVFTVCCDCREFGETVVPAIGHAIRRFVRVCEVERLTVAARARMLRHDHACNVRQPGDGCVADTGHTALDRLAAMAMGGDQ